MALGGRVRVSPRSGAVPAAGERVVGGGEGVIYHVNKFKNTGQALVLPSPRIDRIVRIDRIRPGSIASRRR